MNELLKFENVTYDYDIDNETDTVIKDPAISEVSFTVSEGEFVCIIGRNGSGKSTIARLINALLSPSQGTVYVNGIDTRNEEATFEIRRATGMVFQNPDNQIIGTTVEEDVAFGPENLGIEHDEMVKRVTDAIHATGLDGAAKSEPHLLSGGQKQRVAIAGILAMKPSCIVLDESTAMLDPSGRRDVLSIIEKLNREGITIILITHHMDEIVNADRVILVDDGQIVKKGTPSELFADYELVQKSGLDLPPVAKLFNRLGYAEKPVLTIDEGLEVLSSLIKEN